MQGSQTIAERHGFPSDDEELSGLFDCFCTENARNRSERFEYTLVATESVSAFYRGLSARQRTFPVYRTFSG